MIKKVIILGIFICVSFFGFSQEDTLTIGQELPEKDSLEILQIRPDKATDVIVLHEGTRYYVDVKKIYKNLLYYSFPDQTKVYKIDRRTVHKVLYKSGIIDVLSEKQREVEEISDWKKIKITEDKDDVEDMVEVIALEAISEGKEGGNATPKSLERNARIILRRKAALENADIVLITGKQTQVAFGEPPSLTLKAIAYKYKNK